ncbi:MAG: hypothetical protein QME75_12625 [Deltaproteobacteria bacterium]|nr:hypothetical protein [Deltaproteobacteria bacterium]
MVPARRLKEDESDSLFTSLKAQEKQAIFQQLRLIALEKQNRRLKAAVTLLSLFLLAATALSGYLHHSIHMSDRAAGAAELKGWSSFLRSPLPFAGTEATRSPEGENDADLPKAPAQSSASKAMPAPDAEAIPVISVNFREQVKPEESDKAGGADHNPGAAALTPADSGAAVPEGAVQSEGAAQPIEAKPAVRYVGSKTSDKYHFPGCKWVKLIRPERLLTFTSVAEARKTHPNACPTCGPPSLDAPESAGAADAEP